MRATPLAVALALLLVPGLHAQDEDLSKVEIKTTPVAGSVHLLAGQGGNIGLSVGPDGAFLIDDEYAPLTPRIRAAVALLTPQPIRFVLNTHWHGDHTGANRDLGAAGALIVAHENVRVRLGSEQFIAFFNERVPPSPAQALPVVTFTEAVTLHLNGDEIRAFHVAPAHTDGDSVVWFRKADVVHTGDLFFNGMYPFIDVSTGGSVDGMIAAADVLLEIVGPSTRIIPGHGPLGTREDLRAFRAMLVTARDRVGALVRAGKTLEQIQAEQPLRALEATWAKGFLKSADFVAILHSDLVRKSSDAPGPDHARAEAEVREAVLAANRAYAANDMPAYWAAYAPDLTQWFAEGRVDLPTYQKDWTKFLSEGGRVEAAEVSDLAVQVSPAADAAVASYVLAVRTREVNGDVKEEVVHETDVLMRRGGAWLVVHLHYTPVETRTTRK